jgi:hypothetical protein
MASINAMPSLAGAAGLGVAQKFHGVQARGSGETTPLSHIRIPPVVVIWMRSFREVVSAVEMSILASAPEPTRRP